MTDETLKKLDEFLRSELMKLKNYYDKSERGAYYRIEHSYRVAYIARDIALKEGFDPEIAFVSGLLHDIGYSIDYSSKDPIEHGRDGARVARPFLKSLGFKDEDIEEICYAIAIHVDYKSDFKHEDTVLSLSIRDADDIDRWDAFRLYEYLHNHDYKNLSIDEQNALIERTVNELKELRKMKRATLTAKHMWEEKIDYQLEFYSKLKNQVDHSNK